MARTRVLVGYMPSGELEALYVGKSGEAMAAAQAANTTARKFEIYENPGRLKNNANFIAPAENAEGEESQEVKRGRGRPKATET